jgi:uncharacterized membrane protein (UPF0136 family)
MKNFTWPIGAFALLLILGGFYGFIKAHSIISLAISSFFGLILLLCTLLIYKEKIPALYVATACICFLHVFFLYRFFKKFKLMPAGLFVLITTALGAPLLYYLTNRIKEKSYIS